jgi:hypothetical protein
MILGTGKATLRMGEMLLRIGKVMLRMIRNNRQIDQKRYRKTLKRMKTQIEAGKDFLVNFTNF